MNETKTLLLRECIGILCDHFQSNGIQSELRPVDDFIALKEILMRSEYTKCGYNENTQSYTIDMIQGESSIEESVYLFIFGTDHVLIDYGERGMRSFMEILADSTRYLPFTRDFLYNGELIVIDTEGIEKRKRISPEDIMTMNEYREYLKTRNTPGYITRINVE